MIPGVFDYHRPSTVDEAVALLAAHGDTARPLAGGHTLIPMMKLRLAVPEHIIDLQAVESLRGIAVAGDGLTIGAMTTQAEIIASNALAESCPLLREAALQIADPQVRACGTIGGNIANGDPANDMPAVMLALDATFVVQGPGGVREIAARSFYGGTFVTALGEDEIVTTIRVPAPAAGHGWAYEKQKRKIGDYATAATAVVLTMNAGKCSTAAVALTNVGDTPLLVDEAGATLVGTTLDEAAIEAAAAAAMAATDPATDPVSDRRGPAAFRTHIAGMMTRRAIRLAASRAG